MPNDSFQVQVAFAAKSIKTVTVNKGGKVADLGYKPKYAANPLRFFIGTTEVDENRVLEPGDMLLVVGEVYNG